MRKYDAMDQTMSSHFILKIFFLFLSIITMVTAVLLTVGYENEYLESDTGVVLAQFGGSFTYVIMVITFIYWLIWIIYWLFRHKMAAGMEDED